jgi:heme exporter protein C
MKLWLKIICVILLFYSAFFAFRHPMSPGGLSVSVDELHPGRNDFFLTGYSTSFLDDQQSLQVFVSVDSSAVYCADVVEVVDNARVMVSVLMPDTISSGRFDFFANTNSDGTIIIDAPVGHQGFTLVPGTKNELCKYQVTHEESQSFGFPYQPIIMESIRNLMWHVPMWFTMFVLMIMSFYFSLRALAMDAGEKTKSFDLKASSSAAVGLLFCTLGLITGSIWARFTWGAWWTNDPQLNGSMVVFIVYVGYFILRDSTQDEDKRTRLAGIFNIFAFVLMVVLLMVMPRFTEGLHPGKSGNPAFSKYDLDSSLRTVFYPAVAGFILLGYWIYDLYFRIKKIQIHEEERA